MSVAQAAVLVHYREPFELRSYPLPERLEPGEALVRIEMAGICGTDVHLWRGELPIPLPVILGHESVGRVERLGPGLSKDWRGARLEVGDRVTWASSVTCGECYYCRIKRQPTRCLHRKAYGISYCADEAPHLRGGYAQFIHLRAGSAIFRLPDALPAEAVVGAGCALTTALHGLERASITLGDIVVIQGSGPVGLAALAVARRSGAAKVVVVGGPAHRLERARQFGAEVVVSVEEVPDAEERRRRVLEETGGYGADVVIECVGSPAVIPEGFELCRDGGTYLVLGQYADAGEVAIRPHTITRKQLQVAGSWGFEPRHLDQALRLLEDPEWQRKFAQHVTHRFPLEQANEALATVREWRCGKAVLVPWEGI
ncbi:MAG: zinc-binding dehydrogenase [Bryobacterales bacterium]|nr:zinc-binding dehydrogenase [Bryobacteraceae bacterium]MDW8355934.1 zinc-binding dehydrogenase [Bryobacterales bacterium]